MDFHVELINGVPVMRLTRPLTREYYPDLPRDASVTLAQNDAPGIVLDMRGVDFADSTGISILLTVKKQTLAAGGKFAVCCLSPYLRDVLDKLSLSEIFNIFENAEVAVASIVK